MGRYQGTSGAAWAASGRVRQPRGAPCGIPGKGKGLIFLGLNRSVAHQATHQYTPIHIIVVSALALVKTDSKAKHGATLSSLATTPALR